MIKKLIIAPFVIIVMLFALPVLAAPNPFMDVPANHWAYDAVAQLAASGVISGYSDCSFKGGQPVTRYEMASAVARALSKVDADKADKRDLELLKKLVLEFKDELGALGIRADKLDGRILFMEKDLGGWSLSGHFRFDAKFGADQNHTGWFIRTSGKNEFDLNRYRLWLRKRIDEKTTFTARIGGAGNNDSGKTAVWEQYSVTTVLPYDIRFTVGRSDFDFEAQSKLYYQFDNDALFHSGQKLLNMFMFEKDWGMTNLKLVIARDNDSGWGNQTLYRDGVRTAQNVERFLIAANANFIFSENFKGGLLAYFYLPDKETSVGSAETESDLTTLGAYLRYAFTPSVELKALYYHQTQGETIAGAMSGRAPGAAGYDDAAKAWKVMLDVKQDALKFTSLWLEYGKMDNNFFKETHPYAINADDLANQRRVRRAGSSSVIVGGWAVQQWNRQWATFARYYRIDMDTVGLDDTVNWTVGALYQYSPALSFQLLYDNIDYGSGNPEGFLSGDDHMIRLRIFTAF